MTLRLSPRWWTLESEVDRRISCHLCPKQCVIESGERGECDIRRNVAGVMVVDAMGLGGVYRVDPIEKKPLYHFLPGTPVLSFGGRGCNLSCDYCLQSDVRGGGAGSGGGIVEITPRQVVEMALERNCRSIAFTENDPVVWAEYAIDTAKIAQAVGLKVVMVSSGYISSQARPAFFHHVDAANIDLKGFDEGFYERVVGGSLQPVLNTLRYLKTQTDIWTELTYLLLEGENDDEQMLTKMCDWVLLNMGDEVPIHFTAFHPQREGGRRVVPTSHERLIWARDLALGLGMKYVYVGNVYDEMRETTYCPSCHKGLIRRNWFKVGAYEMNMNRCRVCDYRISGVFEEGKGSWGRKSIELNVLDSV